ncbi:cytochrome P450, partial [Campylobacter jejuni]|nr:cytochrome P450 [Campylobacter jejuni]
IFLKNLLRLYPPVGFFAREEKKILKLEISLLKGSGVVIAPWLIHRHEEFWTNPHGFNPSRFEGEYKKDAYLPF